MYSKNSVLAKAFKGSSIQAFRYKPQSCTMLQLVLQLQTNTAKVVSVVFEQ